VAVNNLDAHAKEEGEARAAMKLKIRKKGSKGLIKEPNNLPCYHPKISNHVGRDYFTVKRKGREAESGNLRNKKKEEGKVKSWAQNRARSEFSRRGESGRGRKRKKKVGC